MGCTRLSLLVVALLVSSLTPRLPVAGARHVVVLKVNNGLNDRGGDMDPGKEPASGSTDDLSAKKGFGGRKLGAWNMENAEAKRVKGEQKSTQGSQTQQQIAAGSAEAAVRRPASSAATTGSRPRTVEMRTAGKHADPAAEMLYEMLKRDYASRASRRRPINNGVPLQEEEP